MALQYWYLRISKSPIWNSRGVMKARLPTAASKGSSNSWYQFEIVEHPAAHLGLFESLKITKVTNKLVFKQRQTLSQAAC